MIVTNKTNGCIGVPIVGTTEMINLVPGVQDVPNEMYSRAYPTMKRLIEGGFITDEFIKMDKESVKDGAWFIECTDAKDKDKVLVPARIVDIDRRSGDKLSNLIHECFHVPTLEKWEKEELRPDVRMEILQQKKLVVEGDKE